MNLENRKTYTPMIYSTHDLSNLPGRDLDANEIHHHKVLVIDDDPEFITMAKSILCKAGFDVAGAVGSDAGVIKCSEVKPDLILMELMMQGKNGYETYDFLRKITTAPVIIVTDGNHREHVAKILQVGMADYITKPVYDTELIARIQAVIKRTAKPESKNVRIFPEVGLTVKYDTQEVFWNEKFIPLIPRQFSVFAILAQEAPSPVLYRTITEKIWGEDNSKKRTQLKNIIFTLRQKLEVDPANPKLLINYRGLGYRLATQEEWLFT